MQILAWSDDYSSGNLKIDVHHKTLFRMVNSFAEKHDENVPKETLLTFVDNLWEYCKFHFIAEEDMMRNNNFPLLDHHVNLHKSLEKLVITKKDEISKGILKNPFAEIIRLSTDWLNDHIARYDLAFFSFNKNKDYDLSKHMIGRMCEISTMNNELVCVGTIESIVKNEVVISHNTGMTLPIELNDIIKVSSSSSSPPLSSPTEEEPPMKDMAAAPERRAFQAFIAIVYYCSPDVVKLFNASIIKTKNDREYFRVKVDMAAALWIGAESFPATIVDISATGMKMAAYQPIELCETVTVGFVVQNNTFMESCKILRAVKQVDGSNCYGVSFESMSEKQSGKLITFLFNKQALIRQGIF